MKQKKVTIIKKLIASLLSLVFLIANPLMAQANWQQPEPPSTYLNPNEVNANNPDPLTEALNKAGTSPFNTDTASLPNNKPSQPATVDIIQGKLTLNSTDLKIPAEGSPVILHWTYTSGSTQVGPFVFPFSLTILLTISFLKPIQKGKLLATSMTQPVDVLSRLPLMAIFGNTVMIIKEI